MARDGPARRRARYHVAVPLGIGSVVGDRYRIDANAGAGGFGEVYRATDLTLGATVAIKTIHLGVSPSQETRAEHAMALLDEARNLSRLRHFNIVAALDAGLVEQEGGAVPYLVVEWMEGPTLAQHLARNAGPRTLAETWALIDPIVRALAHAHAMGIAHRDLKPSNVMMDEVGGVLTPRLIDFGIAKTVEAGALPGSGATGTSSDSSPFTPAYAAPEQIVAARTGPWTDVHALGLLFVEISTGRHPYGDGSGPTAISPERPTPAALGAAVGPFEDVIAQALSLRPRERYADARALLAALRAAATASGLAAGSTDLPPPAPTITIRSNPPPGEDGPISVTVPSDRTVPEALRVQRAIERARIALPARAPLSRRRMLMVAAGASVVTVGGTIFGVSTWLDRREDESGPRELARLDAVEIERRLRRAFQGVTAVEPITRAESNNPDIDEVTLGWANYAGFVRLRRFLDTVTPAQITAWLRDEREAEAFVTYAFGYAVQGGAVLVVRARDRALVGPALDALCRGTEPTRRSDGKQGAPPIDGF